MGIIRFTQDVLNFVSGDHYENQYVNAPHPQLREAYLPGEPEWIQIEGKEMRTYETCAPLALVVDKKAKMKAVGKIRHWKGSKNTKEDKEMFDTPELNLLYNPNPSQSKSDFLKEFSVHRDIHGIAYLSGVFTVSKNLSQVPVSLWSLPPKLVSFETTGKLYKATTQAEMFKSIWFDKNGAGEFPIKPEDILFRPIGGATSIIKPQSPLTKVRTELSNIIAAMAYRNVILRKKGALGILSGDQRDSDGTVPMDDVEFKRIEKQYQKSYGLYSRQMQILMSTMPMKWTPMSYPTKDLMLFEEVDNNTMKIIDLYGMHADLFSFMKGSTLSESGGRMAEAERQTFQTTIIEESEDDMNALSKWLGLHKRGEYLTLDYSHVPSMHDNEELAAKVMTMKIAAFVSMLALENKVPYAQALEMAGLKED